MHDKNMVIDVRITGYMGDPCRVIATYNANDAKLNISKILPYGETDLSKKTPEELEKIKALDKYRMVVVDRADAFAKWDLHFIEMENLQAAIGAYFELHAMKRLELSKEVKSRYPLNDIVQVKTLKERGREHEINQSDTQNGHMAIIIACWAAMRGKGMVEISRQPTQQEVSSAELDEDFMTPFSI